MVKRVTTITTLHGKTLPYGAVYGKIKTIEWYCESFKTYGSGNDYYIYVYNSFGKWKEVNTCYSRKYLPIKRILDSVTVRYVREWHDFKSIDLPYRRRCAEFR